MQYRTRWFELLMLHKADHGSLPPDNAKNPPPPRAAQPRLKGPTMDFEPNSEQQMLIDQVRRFVREEIIPLEAKLDPDASELDPRGLHARLVEKTKAMGLFGIDIPKEFGGARHRYRHPRRCWRSRWRSIAPGSMCPATACSAAPASPSSSRPTRTRRSAISIRRCAARRSRFFGLTEPSGGSDPARAIQTRARAQGQWLGAERRQDLHLGRRPRAVRHRVRPHRRRQGPRRHHLLHRRRRHAGLPRAPRRAHAALVALRHRAAVQGSAGVGPIRCWARSTRASPSPTTG